MIELRIVDNNPSLGSIAHVDRVVIPNESQFIPANGATRHLSGRVGVIQVAGTVGDGQSPIGNPDGVFAAQIGEIQAGGSIDAAIEASANPSATPAVDGRVARVISLNGNVLGRIAAVRLPSSLNAIAEINGALGLGSAARPLTII
ncbi:MAG: hypothetical protein ACK5XO_00520, partial [Phycisphaerales bacterium]